MNQALNKAKNSIVRQKKMYFILIGLVVVGLISGVIFTTVLSKIDQNLVQNSLKHFFEEIKIGKIDYTGGLINSIASNFLYGIGVWLLGISIIGLPIIIFLLFMKGFITGFSIGSIISLYHFKGILGAIGYVFPHHILGLCFGILLSFYAISFSFKLFSMLFLKKEINFKEAMRKYIKILIIVLVGLLVTSLFEVFVAPFFLKFFAGWI